MTSFTLVVILPTLPLVKNAETSFTDETSVSRLLFDNHIAFIVVSTTDFRPLALCVKVEMVFHNSESLSLTKLLAINVNKPVTHNVVGTRTSLGSARMNGTI